MSKRLGPLLAGSMVTNLILASCLTVGATMVATDDTVSLPIEIDSARIDGIPLTEQEMDIVRGVRMHDQRMQSLQKNRAQRIAELTSKLMEMGPEKAKLHQSRRPVSKPETIDADGV